MAIKKRYFKRLHALRSNRGIRLTSVKIIGIASNLTLNFNRLLSDFQMIEIMLFYPLYLVISYFISRGLLKKGFPMFRLNDKVVYPGHGVAKITRIVEKIIAGQSSSFYELKFLNKEMTVLVPIANTMSIGLRPLSSNNSIDGIFKMLAEPAKKLKHYELTANNWNKRNKEYQSKLRTGNIEEITEIYRDLKHIALQKELSFGEKNLLNQTENLLAEEISIVMKLEAEKTVEQLRSIFSSMDMLSKNRQKEL